LKIKPAEAPKIKKIPVYSESKPRKNQMQELFSKFIGEADPTGIAEIAEIDNQSIADPDNGLLPLLAEQSIIQKILNSPNVGPVQTITEP
jgi:hypothetical protein